MIRGRGVRAEARRRWPSRGVAEVEYKKITEEVFNKVARENAVKLLGPK